MAGVGHEHVAVGGRHVGGNGDEVAHYLVQTFAGAGRQGGGKELRVESRELRVEGRSGDEVGLVEDEKGGGVGDPGDEVRVEGQGGVVDVEDDAGRGDGSAGAVDTDAFHSVGAGTQAGCVDEAEEVVAQVQGLLDGVAGGAWHVADDGAVVAQQGVEQRGFAGVGGADDGHGDAAHDCVAGAKTLEQALDLVPCLSGELCEQGAVGELEVFFGEVEFEFEQGGDVDELLAELLYASGKLALQLALSDVVGGTGLGGDDVGHGFGLAQVEASAQEGAAGELSGFGQAGTCLN